MGYMRQDGREDYDNINVQVSLINESDVFLKEMRAQLGDFQYDDDHFERSLGDREQRNMVVLENGARYEGEWLLGS